jgi:hypothetical protein
MVRLFGVWGRGAGLAAALNYGNALWHIAGIDGGAIWRNARCEIKPGGVPYFR